MKAIYFVGSLLTAHIATAATPSGEFAAGKLVRTFGHATRVYEPVQNLGTSTTPIPCYSTIRVTGQSTSLRISYPSAKETLFIRPDSHSVAKGYQASIYVGSAPAFEIYENFRFSGDFSKMTTANTYVYSDARQGKKKTGTTHCVYQRVSQI